MVLSPGLDPDSGISVLGPLIPTLFRTNRSSPISTLFNILVVLQKKTDSKSGSFHANEALKIFSFGNLTLLVPETFVNEDIYIPKVVQVDYSEKDLTSLISTFSHYLSNIICIIL